MRLAGNKAEACCIRASLQEPAREGRVSVAEMATNDIALGESDRAVGRLREASKEHLLEPLYAVPALDALRSPPYAEFFTRVEPVQTAGR